MADYQATPQPAAADPQCPWLGPDLAIIPCTSTIGLVHRGIHHFAAGGFQNSKASRGRGPVPGLSGSGSASLPS